MSSNKDIKSVPGRMLCAGLAGCSADLVTFPLDTVKVWLQVRNVSSGVPQPTSSVMKGLHHSASSLQTGSLSKNATADTAAAANKISKFSIRTNYKLAATDSVTSTIQHQVRKSKNKGIVHTVVNGVKKNGATSLYGGISAGLQRQLGFCAVRIGFYDSLKTTYMNLFQIKSEVEPIPIRILAGTSTAVIAVACFQPTEVVKIRMQAQARAPKEHRKYGSTVEAYKHLYKGGVKEAWRGIGANTMRLGVVNVSELVTYDVVKELLVTHRIMSDSPVCHFTSAFIAGFVTTLVASPIDVVKTRYMNAKKGKYTGVIDCTKKLMLQEGPLAFYKGFIPAYLRLGSWNIVMFMAYEQYKRMWQTNYEE